MKISVQYDGGLENAADRILTGTENALALTASDICSTAKSLCPVDTGTLKNSIGYTVQQNSAVISANTDYAVYVEFGTSKMSPQPYLVPALIAGSDMFLQRLLQEALG